MKINQTGTQYIFDSGEAVDIKTPDKTIAIKILVGYHNYFRVGYFEAIRIVEKCLLDAGLTGWMASACDTENLPAGAIRVGQVTVHSGDRDYPLYVIQRQPTAKIKGEQNG